MDTVDWLLDSDPAIRWQAMRDLTNASPAAIAAERARVPREGLGAQILAHQGSDGSWHRADAPVWLSTLYTLLLLRATGIDRAEPAVAESVEHAPGAACAPLVRMRKARTGELAVEPNRPTGALSRRTAAPDAPAPRVAGTCAKSGTCRCIIRGLRGL